MLGGIDKHVLRRSKEEIRRELEYKLQPLMQQGGMVFGLDHRILTARRWRTTATTSSSAERCWACPHWTALAAAGVAWDSEELAEARAWRRGYQSHEVGFDNYCSEIARPSG